MVMCFAPTCKHYSESHSCRFFGFPKDHSTLRKWLKSVGRKDREPSKYSRICSCHFIEGIRNNGPTTFNHNKGKQFPKLIRIWKIRQKEAYHDDTLMSTQVPCKAGVTTQQIKEEDKEIFAECKMCHIDDSQQISTFYQESSESGDTNVQQIKEEGGEIPYAADAREILISTEELSESGSPDVQQIKKESMFFLGETVIKSSEEKDFHFN